MSFTEKAVTAFHCPRWDELPSLSLYMDQVMIVLEEALSLFCEDKEHIITPTMINNYVKQKAIAPPEKKKYGREHLANLMMICALKKVLSISEATGLIELLLEENTIQAAYDIFCAELEHSLKRAFVETNGHIELSVSEVTALSVLDAALTTLTGKLVVQKALMLRNDVKAKKPAQKPAAKQTGADSTRAD